MPDFQARLSLHGAAKITAFKNIINLQAFGIELDPEKNEMTTNGKTASIESVSSKIKVLVIPTDEELSIAEQTLEVVSSL